jgi:hypothetical protein
MNKLVLAGFLAVAAFGFAPVVPASAAPSAPRYESRGEAQNARAACILPWYRFFGACDAAIDAYPYGNHWHDWNNRHYHGRYR